MQKKSFYQDSELGAVGTSRDTVVIRMFKMARNHNGIKVLAGGGVEATRSVRVTRIAVPVRRDMGNILIEGVPLREIEVAGDAAEEEIIE